MRHAARAATRAAAGALHMHAHSVAQHAAHVVHAAGAQSARPQVSVRRATVRTTPLRGTRLLACVQNESCTPANVTPAARTLRVSCDRCWPVHCATRARAALVARDGGQHHVRAVQAVDEVGRERGALLGLDHRQVLGLHTARGGVSTQADGTACRNAQQHARDGERLQHRLHGALSALAVRLRARAGSSALQGCTHAAATCAPARPAGPQVCATARSSLRSTARRE